MEELTRSGFLKTAGAAVASVSLAGAFAEHATGAFAAIDESRLVPYSGPIGATSYPATILSVPVLVAYEKGFFKKQKLDLKMTVMNSATDLARAIHARQLAFGVGGILTVMSGFAAGLSEIRLIGQMVGAQYITYVLPAGSSIKSPSDLKGKKIAVLTNTKNFSYYLATLMLKQGGLTPDDVNWVFVQSFPAALAAVQNGVVDCACSFKPVSTQEEIDGHVRVLWDTGPNVTGLPNDGVFTGATIAATHPKVCQQFATAIAQAQQWVRHNVKETASMWAKATQLDPKVCLATLQGTVANSMTFPLPISGFNKDRAAGVALGTVPPTLSYYAFVDPRFGKSLAKYSK